MEPKDKGSIIFMRLVKKDTLCYVPSKLYTMLNQLLFRFLCNIEDSHSALNPQNRRVFVSENADEKLGKLFRKY
jgi:hypothetical protein